MNEEFLVRGRGGSDGVGICMVGLKGDRSTIGKNSLALGIMIGVENLNYFLDFELLTPPFFNLD